MQLLVPFQKGYDFDWQKDQAHWISAQDNLQFSLLVYNDIVPYNPLINFWLILLATLRHVI